MGMDQYLLIPFLVGWTSIYQLFWCSPGVLLVLTHCQISLAWCFPTCFSNFNGMIIPIHLVTAWGSLCFPRNRYHLGQNYEPWALQPAGQAWDQLRLHDAFLRDRMREIQVVRWVKPGWIGVQRPMPFRVKRSQLYCYPVLRLLGYTYIYIYIYIYIYLGCCKKVVKSHIS